MVQWINLWYNCFVNRQLLPLLYEKTGAIALVLPGLIMAGWQTDKIVLNLKIFKILY